MQKIPLAYTDPDLQRGRLHKNLVDGLNAMVGVTVDVAAPPTANSEFSIAHPDLGKVATEFAIITADQPGQLYRSSPGNWTKDRSFFKYSAAGGRLRIRVR